MDTVNGKEVAVAAEPEQPGEIDDRRERRRIAGAPCAGKY